MEILKKHPGRPLKPDDKKLKQRSIRLTAGQWAKVDVMGLPALRKMIDRWRAR